MYDIWKGFRMCIVTKISCKSGYVTATYVSAEFLIVPHRDSITSYCIGKIQLYCEDTKLISHNRINSNNSNLLKKLFLAMFIKCFCHFVLLMEKLFI
jgi:hypothetical protein